MKKFLLNWRFWLVVVTVCMTLVLLMAEPVNDGNTTWFIIRLVATKAAAILLGIGAVCEMELWHDWFPWINK